MYSLIRGFTFRFVFIGIQFAAGMLIAKLAGTEQFGILSLMIVNAAIIQIITGMGTDASIVWHGISDRLMDRNKVFSFTFYTSIAQLLLFGIAAAFFFLFAGKSILSNGSNIRIFYAELVYFTGLILTEKYSALFYSQQQAVLCNRLLAFAASLLFVSLLLLSIFLPGIIAAHIIWVFSFYSFVPASVIIFFYHTRFSPAIIKINRVDFNSFANFSFIVFVTNLIQFLAFRADFWIISFFHLKSDVGIYAQASRFAQLLWIIPNILAGLVIPALKNENNKLSLPDLFSVCRILFLTHIFLGTAAIAGAFVAYRYFLPADYFHGFPALLLMMPGYILFTITIILAAYFSANRLLKVNLAGSCLCCLLMLTVDFLLIPKFSFTGAAIANFVVYSITTAYFIIVSNKFTGAGIKDYFVLQKDDWKKVINLSLRK